MIIFSDLVIIINFLLLYTRMRRLSSDQVTQITTLLNDGKSTREIAKILGCGKTTVEKYRKMMVNEPAEL